jgi:hypothetical protein
MSWIITGAQPFPAVIGEPFGGGYFAGYISHTADGNPTHALIVAPRATGATGTDYTLTTRLQWKTASTLTPDTFWTFDGAANTAAMVAAGIADHPAAQFCVNLNIGGFTDWYLPSLYEVDIAYFNLKPSNFANIQTGINPYSVPQRTQSYSTDYPSQTHVTAFNTSQEAFTENSHWVSTQYNLPQARQFNFRDAFLNAFNKTTSLNVRAFRRIAL